MTDALRKAKAAEKKAHVCKQSRGCRCRVDGLEPAEDCPEHGWPDHRCDCGRFVARAVRLTERAKEGR